MAGLNREPEPEYPSLGWRGLRSLWTVLICVALGVGGVLQILGPSANTKLSVKPADDRRPVAQISAPGAPTGPAGARALAKPAAAAKGPAAGTDIAALLAKVQAQVAQNPDGLPPGSTAEELLKRIAAVLPQASSDDRRRADDLAAKIYDRARKALQAGKVDEEQRWLALGSFLAPPPDLAPPEPAVQEAAREQGGSRADVTPNEAEADQTTPARHPALTGPDRQDTMPKSVESADQGQSGASPRVAENAGEPAAPGGASAGMEPGGSANASGDQQSAGGDQQNGGTNLSIHVPASAATAGGDRIKQVEARLRSSFAQTEMHTEADVPSRTAVVRYAAADHATARDVGQILGSMGYPWHLERVPAEKAEASARTIEVWIPSGTPVPQYRVPDRVPVRAQPRPRIVWPWFMRSWF